MVWHLFRMHTQEGEIFHWSSCTIHPLEVCQAFQIDETDRLHLIYNHSTIGKPSFTHLKHSLSIRATKSVVFWAAHPMRGTLGILTSALSIESIKTENKWQSNTKCASHSSPHFHPDLSLYNFEWWLTGCQVLITIYPIASYLPCLPSYCAKNILIHLMITPNSYRY